MNRHNLREGILWLELLRILTILFAIGFSLGLQVHLLHQATKFRGSREQGAGGREPTLKSVELKLGRSFPLRLLAEKNIFF